MYGCLYTDEKSLSVFHCNRTKVSLVVGFDYGHVRANGYKISYCDFGELEGWTPHHIYKNVKQVIKNDSKNIFSIRFSYY